MLEVNLALALITDGKHERHIYTDIDIGDNESEPTKRFCTVHPTRSAIQMFKYNTIP